MRIGINGGVHGMFGTAVEGIAEHAVEAERQGLESYWLAQLSGTDALTALAVVGQATESIELGTAVIATWPRHPAMLAGQALTTQSLCGGRLTLGIGLAHKPSIEEGYEIPFERPVRHMREYLDILVPLLTDRSVSTSGEIWSAHTELSAPPSEPTPVMVAAMGEQMLRLTGRTADGTILWLVGPRTVADHIAPTITDAAAAAGRKAPRIVASVPVCVTHDPAGVREQVAGVLAGYNDLPSYRVMMDREGAAGPEDVALIGSADEVTAGLAAFAEAGTTDFYAAEFTLDESTVEATRSTLVEFAGSSD